MFELQIASKEFKRHMFFREYKDPYLLHNKEYNSFIYGARDLKSLLWTAYYDYNGEIKKRYTKLLN